MEVYTSLCLTTKIDFTIIGVAHLSEYSQQYSLLLVTKMMCLVVTLLVVFSSILDHSVEAQCYTDSGEWEISLDYNVQNVSKWIANLSWEKIFVANKTLSAPAGRCTDHSVTAYIDSFETDEHWPLNTNEHLYKIYFSCKWHCNVVISVGSKLHYNFYYYFRKCFHAHGLNFRK